MKRKFSVLLFIFFFLNGASCLDVRRCSDKNISLDYSSINCEPLELKYIVGVGLRGNLQNRVSETLQKIRDKEFLKSNLNSLDTENSNIDITRMSDIVDLIIGYAFYNYADTQAYFSEKHRKRQAQQLAIDITEMYWKILAADDHLDYACAVKKYKEGDTPQLDWMINQLKAHIPYLEKNLTEQTGIHRKWQCYTLVRVSGTAIANTLPDISTLEIESLETYALKHRLGLTDSRKIPALRAEALKVFEKFFPEINFSFTLEEKEDRQHLIYQWSKVGKGVGDYLLTLFPDSGKETEKTLSPRQFEQTVAMGIIVQLRISVLNYADKARQYREFDKIFADYVKMAQEKDIGKTDKNTSGKYPPVKAALHKPEIIGVKFLRDDIITDMITAYNQLLANIGIPVDEWEDYRFE